MGYTTLTIEDAGEGFIRRAREALGVTAFGLNVLVLPPGTEWFHHFHERQDEVYFVHSGRAGARVGDDELELGPGALLHVESTTPRQLWNAGDDELVLLMIGGKDGYVGRDGQLVNPDDLERRTRAADGDIEAIRRTG
jgi:uncharacterized cupin superfamily protein